jgi:Ca-activated chloride channel homolog
VRGIAVLVFCAALAAGQSESRTPESRPPTFNSTATLVLVPATVTDGSNRFLLGLQKKDFHLFEDGVEQKISQFASEDAPLSVGLVFDISGSMGFKLQKSRDAALQFLKTLNAQDEAFLVEFGDKAELTQEFTNKPEDIAGKLQVLQPGGLTAMLDAAELALHEMKKAKNPRKALVVISDGGDNNSKYTASEIESLVREADVQIYAMGVFEPDFFPGLSQEEISGPKLLAEITQQTGGRVFAASDPGDLPSVATRIGVELRNQYVLAYTPANAAKDGKYRKVEVKIDGPSGISNLKVRWRLGYYAPSE